MKTEEDDIPLADAEATSLDNTRGNDLSKTATKAASQLDSLSSSSTRGQSTSTLNDDELEEKERFITQILELQNTLDELSSRIDKVKDENMRLNSENQVLGQYIENLMAASSVFQSTSSPQPQASGESANSLPPGSSHEASSS